MQLIDVFSRVAGSSHLDTFWEITAGSFCNMSLARSDPGPAKGAYENMSTCRG